MISDNETLNHSFNNTTHLLTFTIIKSSKKEIHNLKEKKYIYTQEKLCK